MKTVVFKIDIRAVPTKPGWYWWRPLDRKYFSDEQIERGWRPVLVEEERIGGLSFRVSWQSSRIFLAAEERGELLWEWGGLIPKPVSCGV